MGACAPLFAVFFGAPPPVGVRGAWLGVCPYEPDEGADGERDRTANIDVRIDVVCDAPMRGGDRDREHVNRKNGERHGARAAFFGHAAQNGGVDGRGRKEHRDLAGKGQGEERCHELVRSTPP